MSKSKQKTEVENKKVGFARKKAITVPTLKMNIDSPIYITILEVNYKKTKDKETGEFAVDKKTGELKLLPVAKVVNLENGEVMELVCGAALIAQFQDNFSEEEIKGLSFEITKHAKKTGKDYHTYTIYEIDPSEAA